MQLIDSPTYDQFRGLLATEQRDAYFNVLKWFGRHRHRMFASDEKLSVEQVHATLWRIIAEGMQPGQPTSVTEGSSIVMEQVEFEPHLLRMGFRITTYDRRKCWVIEFSAYAVRAWPEEEIRKDFALVLYSPPPMPPPPDLDFGPVVPAINVPSFNPECALTSPRMTPVPVEAPPDLEGW